jgi:alpha-1,2-mannosyltransferase
LTLIGILWLCTAIDFGFYNKSTSPPLNILLYNAIGGKGDELYGTEPASYYLRNLLLTLGLCWPLGAAAPILVLRNALHKYTCKQSLHREVLQLVVCAPVLLWMLLLFRRPHKEERFMYPIYPLMVLMTSFSIEVMADMTASLLGNTTWQIRQRLYRAVVFVIVLCAMIVGCSRIASNFNNFHGNIHI